ncbi:AMP-binding enzyme [Mesorhizobium caraganae]|uniref:AMP-binding enzyme n=1 Tax=Mesorhizobium caraganae TaxID=483206 RepID=UPI0035E3BDD7
MVLRAAKTDHRTRWLEHQPAGRRGSAYAASRSGNRRSCRVPDTVHGENVHAFVTFKPGAAQPAPQELIHFARASVGYKAPESVFLLDEMPLSATDKVDRVVLKKLAERLLKPEASTG